MDRGNSKRHHGKDGSWEQLQKQRDAQAVAFTAAIAARSNDNDGSRGRWNRSPWLLIRYNSVDRGARPTVGPFWISPDIWIESSDPGGNAVAGEKNYVHARVFNLGTFMAAPVQVDFYWANPALGLGAANMNWIGTEWIRKIKPLAVQPVKCRTPWVPVMLNGGHECLLVSCSNYVLDPLIDPFEPTLDRHVAQRNIAVVNAAAGASIPFRLQMNNLFPVPAQTGIYVRTERVALRRAAGQRLPRAELLAQVAQYGAQSRHKQNLPAANMATATVYGVQESDSRAAPAVRANVLPESVTLSVPAPGTHFARLLLQRDAYDRADAQPMGLLLQELALKPFEQRSVALELTVPGDARPGEFVVYHLEQHAQGFAAGGYAVIVEIGRD